MEEQPYSSQILNDHRVQHAGAQSSFFIFMRPNDNANRKYQENLDTREKIDSTALS